jgi:hypothetical protein
METSTTSHRAIQRLKDIFPDTDLRQRAEGLVAVVVPLEYEMNNFSPRRTIDQDYMRELAVHIAWEYSELSQTILDVEISEYEAFLKSIDAPPTRHRSGFMDLYRIATAIASKLDEGRARELGRSIELGLPLFYYHNGLADLEHASRRQHNFLMRQEYLFFSRMLERHR